MDIIDEGDILNRLNLISHRHRIAFAASCCERLLPNYQAFWVMERWGNPRILRKAMDKVWAVPKDDNLSDLEVNELQSQCSDVMPDTEDFTSFFAGLAINAVAAIIHTLIYCLNSDLNELLLVSRLSSESVENYLNAVNDPHTGVHAAKKQFDDWILTAPLLHAEVEKQKQDLEILSSSTDLTTTLIESLRLSSRKTGIQPFNRGLVVKK